ncbi:MAG: RsmD family RNA methyltransferase, partial [Polaromonas sp.]
MKYRAIKSSAETSAKPSVKASVKPKGTAHLKPPGEIRIIGGQYKRTKLPVPNRPGLRPTPDRVRETLFNWLGQDLTGWRCVDVFAGTGALGFEAASRGAAEVLLCEQDPA